jgi:hypothetical protein
MTKEDKIRALAREGNAITDRELLSMVLAAGGGRALETAKATLQPSAIPRGLNLELTNEERDNHLVCRLCEQRDRRTCILSGKALKYHWVNWNCPAGRFPNQSSPVQTPAAMVPAHPSGFWFFDADRRGQNLQDRYRGRSAFLITA